jgi:hypothetical protein
MYSKYEIESAEKTVISILECLATTKVNFVKTIIDSDVSLKYVKKALNEAGYKFEIQGYYLTIEV